MKKRMNKIITLGISLSMLALSACGNAGTDASSKAVTEDSSVSAEASVEVAEATKPEELGSGDVKWTDTNNRSRSASSDTIRVNSSPARSSATSSRRSALVSGRKSQKPAPIRFCICKQK